VFRKIYLDKDELIGNKKGTEEEERKRGTKRDALSIHLFHINECIYFYESGNYNEFIKASGYKINSVQNKIDLKESIEQLKSMKDKPIGEVIDFADEKGIWRKDERFLKFITEKEYVYKRVKAIKYQELCNLYDFVEGFTPFSTQHSIKGAEFDNVLVAMDNGGWSMFNFKNMMLDEGNADVLERTKKMFYVCCTRAKKNLVVLFVDASEKIIERANLLFGQINVKSF
jgi:DNA helicase II / ATP-dependent DNA helicase PcrA